jgi:hypothetical protein
MGSTTRWRDIYGGEYAPIGLRLFAWWKKNGERRLQKLGSGSAKIRSYLNWRAAWSFYRQRVAFMKPNLICTSIATPPDHRLSFRSIESISWSVRRCVPRTLHPRPHPAWSQPNGQVGPARMALRQGAGRST